MKTTATLLLLTALAGLHLSCRAQTDSTPRERILMDSGWRFLRGEVAGAAAAPQGTPVTNWRWIAAAAGEADAAKMAAPDLDASGNAWKDARTGQDTFGGKVGFAWFRTILPSVPDSVRMLHFEGVDDNATVYLNGRRLFHHEGWDDPFDIDLAPAWKPGGPNALAVLVENTAGQGGITAPVFLQNPAMNAVASGPAAANFQDRSWRTVHLPHDFVIEGTFSPKADAGHGSLPTTTGWYRKTFDLPNSDKGKSLWVDFDGVYRDSKVWLNGHFLGRHASGYTSFRYNIAPYANYGGRNALAVHVDPTHTEGWWYEGGGIYRHVWLNKAAPVHAAPWGTFVSSHLPEPEPSGLADAATVTIKTMIANDGANAAACQLVSLVFDPTGKIVARATTPLAVERAGREVSQQVNVTRPQLWSLENPYLYHLVTMVEQAGKAIDRTVTPFGIRTIRFDADKGFFLNGKPVKIQGTCNHQDFVGVGIGVSDSLEDWRVRTLKQLGANGWRMSHNPPTSELLDACDKRGMLVMDENRHLGDSDGNLAEVANMVQRDRNHPSIIMWSMCNEENGQQGKETGAKIFAAMMQTVKNYDTTRPVSSAMNGGWFDPGFATVEDMLGINYGLGNADKFHQLHPTMPIFGSETASTRTTRGEYADDKERVFVSSYNMTDGSWQDIANRPFVAGSFVWTGFDYKGEPSPYVWPDINSHFGILDMCGFPKDNYYYYQSWWKTTPIVHLMPHWNWPGKEGQNIRVIAFSNCARVVLLLNGQSLGAKDMPRNGHLEWTVPYAPGTLSAKGYDAADAVTASDIVETTGPPASLRLSTDRTTLAADGEDVLPIKVEVLDAQGRVVPTADNLVTFSVKGAGHVAGVGNGNPGDHDPDQASYRHAFNGLCMVVVGAGEKGGGIQLTASSPGLKSAGLGLSAR